MMRRLFDAVVRRTVSYGCEVWAPACFLALVPQLKDMQCIRLSFFRNLCQLRKSVTPHIIFREFAERPWLDSWWSMVLGFTRRLSWAPVSSLALVQFRPGSHTLPIEQGRFARPALLRHLRRCTVCDTQAVGDELQCVFDCPHLSDIRAPISWPVPRCCGVHAYVHVAQGPEVCLPLSHCLAAEGSDMNTIPSS